MKTIILAICIALLSGGCASEKEKIVPPVDGKDEVLTETYTCLIGEPIRITVDLEANGYSIKNNNPKELSYEYLSNVKVIRMISLQEGDLSIHITDVEGSIIRIIKITARYWECDNIEVSSDVYQNEKTKATVEAYNQEVKHTIEKELEESLSQRMGTKYSFDKKTRKFTMNNDKTGEKYEGTYVWNIDSLMLNHDGIIEKYGFRHTPRGKLFIICCDRTKEYQLLYPNDGITAITVQEIWRNKNILDIY